MKTIELKNGMKLEMDENTMDNMELVDTLAEAADDDPLAVSRMVKLVLGTEDVLVHIEGEHSCMTARGIRKPGTVTTTTVSCGAFKTDAALRTEVFSQL